MPSDEEYLKMRYSEWWRHVSDDTAKRYHARNVRAVKRAEDEYAREDRPLRVLLVHGSGRNPGSSCAHEVSNSAMLLRTGMKMAKALYDEPLEVDDLELRELALEPCNGCYSTASTWCHWPCTCFPMDGMQQVYPKIIRSDVLLFSTPVNQSAMATRLKTVLDRLISADGGVFLAADQYRPKDELFKRQAMALAAKGDFAYSPRMAGRVCGYVITSKDQKNDLPVPPDESQKYDYATLVAYSLRKGQHDYGCLHADPWHVVAAANPHEEMQYDKAHYNKEPQLWDRVKEMILSAVELAREVRRVGHAPVMDRVNRT